MEFNNGVLGVLIVVLAFMASIGVGFFMSLDSVNVDKEISEQVADINGLFDSTSIPTYIEYNPSSNYTGYHPQSDRDYAYFGGVLYNENMDDAGHIIVNNYPVKYEPTISATQQVTLDGSYEQAFPADHAANIFETWGLVPGNSHIYWVFLPGSILPTAIYPDDTIIRPNIVTMRTLMEQFADADSDTVSIIIPETANHPIVFERSIYKSTNNNCTAYTQQYNPNVNVIRVDIDIPTETATYYRENESIGTTVPVDKLCIAYGGSGVSLSSTISYYTQDVPDISYLDIRYGVQPMVSEDA